MKQAEIKLQLQSVCDVLDIRFNAFFNNKGIPSTPNIPPKCQVSLGNTHAGVKDYLP